MKNIVILIIIPLVMGQFDILILPITFYISATYSGCNLTCAGNYNEPFDSIINALSSTVIKLN